MLQRLGPLVVAVIVAIAPASRAVCEILCAAGAGGSSTTHSCHDTQPTGAQASIEGHDHFCGHADALPVATSVSGDLVMSSLDVAVGARLALPRVESGGPVQRAAPSPPDPHGPAIRLRI